jgi:hypothetical protein
MENRAADFPAEKADWFGGRIEYIPNMSLAEIKEAVRGLTPTELADVERLVADLRREATSTQPRVREAQPADPDVPAAMDAVFEKHRELLRRLAQ